MTRYFFACLLFLSARLAWAAAPAFAVGQTWSYETRKGEGESRLVVLRIDDGARGGRIVHIGITGAKLTWGSGQPAVPWQMDHMPIAEVALRKSVTTLLAEAAPTTFPGFEASYLEWKKKADAGDRQLWTNSVAKAIDWLEALIRRTQKQKA